MKEKKNKELKLNAAIAPGDLTTKINQAKGWIEDGHRVKVSMRFRGRENQHRDVGLEKFKLLVDDLINAGAVINSPMKDEGTTVFITVEGKTQHKLL